MQNTNPNPTITIGIMTKNEADDITACLESSSWADEVLVLDCGSTDATQEICRNYAKDHAHVKLMLADWPGFGEQCNRLLKFAQSDWVLILDADERVTPELRDEILATIRSNDLSAYTTPRHNIFCGRTMKYSLNADTDTPVRLIKKGCGGFKNIVHPAFVNASGKLGNLQHYLLHYPYRDLAEIIDKVNSYSTLGVQNLLNKKTKPSILKAFTHATWTFIRIYILKRGFLDGWPGFLIAFSNFETTFYRYAKLVEHEQNKR